ncbi:MAG: DUF2244 domain-containing protein [Hyphomicrobiaceae bacterium]
MDENDHEAQAREIVGLGLTRELGKSRARTTLADRPRGNFRFELVAYRSLNQTGFMALMIAVVAINLVVGLVFLFAGAWPILGFCGLDVALVYWAFKVNYRDGRASETIDLTPDLLTLTRLHPSGSRERFEFNPYWVRVRLIQEQDGRNELMLVSRGEGFHFARFLSDDERREFAESLIGALHAARSTSFKYLNGP